MANTVEFLQTLHHALRAYATWENAQDNLEHTKRFYAKVVPPESIAIAESTAGSASRTLAEHADRVEHMAREWLSQLREEG